MARPKRPHIGPVVRAIKSERPVEEITQLMTPVLETMAKSEMRHFSVPQWRRDQILVDLVQEGMVRLLTRVLPAMQCEMRDAQISSYVLRSCRGVMRNQLQEHHRRLIAESTRPGVLHPVVPFTDVVNKELDTQILLAKVDREVQRYHRMRPHVPLDLVRKMIRHKVFSDYARI